MVDQIDIESNEESARSIRIVKSSDIERNISLKEWTHLMRKVDQDLLFTFVLNYTLDIIAGLDSDLILVLQYIIDFEHDSIPSMETIAA